MLQNQIRIIVVIGLCITECYADQRADLCGLQCNALQDCDVVQAFGLIPVACECKHNGG